MRLFSVEILQSLQKLLCRDTVKLRQCDQVCGERVRKAVFPFADRLPADAEGLRHKFPGHFAADPVFPKPFRQGAADRLNLLPSRSALDLFAQSPNDEDEQIYKQDKQGKKRNCCDEGSPEMHRHKRTSLDVSILPQEARLPLSTIPQLQVAGENPPRLFNNIRRLLMFLCVHRITRRQREAPYRGLPQPVEKGFSTGWASFQNF